MDACLLQTLGGSHLDVKHATNDQNPWSIRSTEAPGEAMDAVSLSSGSLPSPEVLER